VVLGLTVVAAGGYGLRQLCFRVPVPNSPMVPSLSIILSRHLKSAVVTVS